MKKGSYVLYWMQQSQRAEYNHALEFAIQQANALKPGCAGGFRIDGRLPEANLRHYTFMLEGLRETQAALAGRGIKMVVRHGAPADVALALGRRPHRSSSAIAVTCATKRPGAQGRPFGRLSRGAGRKRCGHPDRVVSNKAEYAARTIRPKIHKHLNDYLIPFDSERDKIVLGY